MFLPGVHPYDLDLEEKRRFLARQLAELLEHHRARCAGYASLVAGWDRGDSVTAERYPFIPVTIFKEYDLVSTTGDVMSLRSSATSSDRSSRIFVDRATRGRQTISASKVLADFIGPARRPYVIFDLEKTVRGVESMSARGAAILSLAHLASEFYFVLREPESEAGELRLDEAALRHAMSRIGDQPFIAYGFTYILYDVHRLVKAAGAAPWAAHPDTVFLHSGGWKRLTSLAVDKPTFNETIASVWGISPRQVIDFYGVVEQVGVPYPDCSVGYKHVPYWADVIIRRSDTLEPADVEERGLIQLINCLPLSAPNHSVLTEDLGELVTRDGCGCGRRGKAFVFRGRAPQSEVRGCSDVPRR